MLVRLSRYLTVLRKPHAATVRLSTRMESFSTVQLTDEVLTEKRGSLMLATLNRPKALNSLNHSMVVQLNHHFKQWDNEVNDISAIVIQGAGGKAFCAGGDVKEVVLAEKEEDRIDFFRNEYQMNHTIAKMQKPMISLMDGIVMGGGCGVAMHTPFRIATERTVCAMPECVIGFMPDVGSSYFLNRLPDAIGAYMAVTGKRLKGCVMCQFGHFQESSIAETCPMCSMYSTSLIHAFVHLFSFWKMASIDSKKPGNAELFIGLELKAVGLATHYISSQKMSDIVHRLQEMGPSVRDHSIVDSKLKQFEDPFHLKEMPALLERLSKMGHVFNPFHNSLHQIRMQLESSEDDISQEALQNMNGGAPLSLALTHSLLKRTAGQSLRSCLETEFIAAFHLSKGKGEFFEGVRALLIDKHKTPKWKYPTDQITEAVIESFFQAEDGHMSLFHPTSKM